MIRYNKQNWSLDIGDKFFIQFNWLINGIALGVDIDTNKYGNTIEFKLIKPTISFGYYKGKLND